MTCFFLDTNILFKRRFVEALSLRCRGRGHRLCVSALVHMERVCQLRRQKGAGFDSAFVEAYIAAQNIEIIPFDRAAAEQVALALAAEFPTDGDWQVAKWLRCARAVGQDTSLLPVSPRSPATLDWLIARHAAEVDAVIVSDDRGSEFMSVRCVDQEEALQIAMAEGG